MEKNTSAELKKSSINNLMAVSPVENIDHAIEALQTTAIKLASSQDPAIKTAIKTLERCASRLEHHYIHDETTRALTERYMTAERGLGERLRRQRESYGLTQKILADMAGTNQAVIQKIENGKSIRPRILCALAVALDVNPAWLQYGDPYANKRVSEAHD
jgi:ribosome-binding protein aMBF1 (putative translation factor)